MRKSYPLNEHPEIVNLKHLADLRAEKETKQTAFLYMENENVQTVTYEDFKQDIEGLGSWFYSENIRNLKVALIGENSYEWILTYFAVVSGSNIIVPMDKELPADEIQKLLRKGGADVLVYANSYLTLAKDMIEAQAVKRIIPMKDFSSFIKRGKEHIKDGFTDFICNEIDEEAVCSILFTSGTTGEPKGVMLSQKNLVTDIMGAFENVYIVGSSLLTLPLHHTFAFSTSVLAMMLCGVPVFINNSLRTFMKDMQQFQPQNMFLVPLYVETMYKRIWQNAERQKKDGLLRVLIKISRILRRMGIDVRRILFKSILTAFGGNLTLIVSGGAPIEQKYIDGFDDIGIQVLNGYGITECSPVVAVNRNRRYKKNSVGLPLPRCEVKIIDGEICVSGGIVMKGYYEDKEATNAAFTGKWFKTGDLGYLDEDGFLYITGRKKNLIILSNGKNVSPEELEERIKNIPGVTEVLVYGENDLITAEIYAEEGEDVRQINSKEVEERIRQEIQELNKMLPVYKRVQRVKFRNNEFEKTTTKKIKRK